MEARRAKEKAFRGDRHLIEREFGLASSTAVTRCTSSSLRYDRFVVHRRCDRRPTKHEDSPHSRMGLRRAGLRSADLRHARRRARIGIGIECGNFRLCEAARGRRSRDGVRYRCQARPPGEHHQADEAEEFERARRRWQRRRRQLRSITSTFAAATAAETEAAREWSQDRPSV
jgi:hypothetical protein